MELGNNTILITGGGSGIGLALAKKFLSHGSKVIVCGRRIEVLKELEEQNSGCSFIQCDVSIEAERFELAEKIKKDFPEVNIFINNAGIQNRPPLLTSKQDWNSHAKEIEINLKAPIHLSMLMIEHLTKKKNPAIINVTSGLAFVPIAFMPTYCATKAALHSFTLSLRYQLKSTPIKIFEVAPPAVNTDLGGKGLHDFGVPLDIYANYVILKLAEGVEEFGYQSSEEARVADYDKRKMLFNDMNTALGPMFVK